MILAERKKLLKQIASGSGWRAREARRALKHYDELKNLPYGSKRARFLRRAAERIGARAVASYQGAKR